MNKDENNSILKTCSNCNYSTDTIPYSQSKCKGCSGFSHWSNEVKK